MLSELMQCKANIIHDALLKMGSEDMARDFKKLLDHIAALTQERDAANKRVEELASETIQLRYKEKKDIEKNVELQSKLVELETTIEELNEQVQTKAQLATLLDREQKVVVVECRTTKLFYHGIMLTVWEGDVPTGTITLEREKYAAQLGGPSADGKTFLVAIMEKR